MKPTVLSAVAVAACGVAWVIALPQTPAAQGGGAQERIVCQGAPGAPPPRQAAEAPAAGAGAGQGQGGGAAQEAPPAPPKELAVTAIPGVIAAGAKFTRVYQTVGNNVDGVVAWSDGSLLASQEDNNAVIRIDKNDHASVFLSGTSGAGSLSVDRQGRLFTIQRMPQRGTPAGVWPTAATSAGIAMLLPARKTFDTFVDGKKMTGRPSDVSADSTGGAWFTQGCVYYANPEGKISLVGENVRSNGVVLSEDEKRLYVTNGGSIVVFDVAGPGKLTNQREFAKLGAGGNADGIMVDTQGRLYVAAGPGVQVFTKDGKYIGVIPTPPGRPTTEAFAGPDRKTLYVVVWGGFDDNGQPLEGRSIYRIPALAQGLPVRSK